MTLSRNVQCCAGMYVLLMLCMWVSGYVYECLYKLWSFMLAWYTQYLLTSVVYTRTSLPYYIIYLFWLCTNEWTQVYTLALYFTVLSLCVEHVCLFCRQWQHVLQWCVHHLYVRNWENQIWRISGRLPDSQGSKDTEATQRSTPVRVLSEYVNNHSSFI